MISLLIALTLYLGGVATPSITSFDVSDNTELTEQITTKGNGQDSSGGK
jgi:hypothetical protein